MHEGINSPETLNAFPMIVQLKQQNTFVYSAITPRRQPKPNSYFKNYFVTFGSRGMAEAYVLQKARDLHKQGQRSFCFRDFHEIKPNSFKQIVFRLRNKGELTTMKPRTRPQFYTLMHPPSPDEFENF